MVRQAVFHTDIRRTLACATATVSTRTERLTIMAADLADLSKWTTMSNWDKFSVEAKVREILDVAPNKRDHHFGRPFLTSYQIAISFADSHPKEAASIANPVGGKGTGPQDSLAKYLALQLSKRIKSGKLADVEGRFLHGENLKPLQFDRPKGQIEASTGQCYSMFRLLGS